MALAKPGKDNDSVKKKEFISWLLTVNTNISLHGRWTISIEMAVHPPSWYPSS